MSEPKIPKGFVIEVSTIITDGKTPYSGKDYPVHSNAPCTKEEHEANAKLIAAAPEMLEVLRWLDNEMYCRDDEFGGCLFSRGDFEKVRRAIKLAMEG